MVPSFPNFRNYSNSDYQKSSLTFISEYQKLLAGGNAPDSTAARSRLLLAMDGSIGEKKPMQSTDWAPEHSEALRQHLAKGMSYSEIAEAINAKFGTAYSRNATIGRGKRMGLAGPDRPQHRLQARPKAPPKPSRPRLHKRRERDAPALMRPLPIFERAEPVKFRCVEIAPRHLTLVELEAGDCRYPYEEGEAITFCGHPQRQGSSYCTPHFHLTRGSGTASEPAAGTVSLRLVEAA
jgi:GcrA cell cycle regulator